MLTKIDPRVRVTIYAGVVCVGAVLVAWGVTTQDVVDAIVPVLGGLLVATGGGVAARNVGDTPQAKATQNAIDGVVASIPVILSTIDSIQRQISNVAPAALPETQTIEYVPEVAPWLEPEAKHRLIE